MKWIAEWLRSNWPMLVVCILWMLFGRYIIDLFVAAIQVYGWKTVLYNSILILVLLRLIVNASRNGYIDGVRHGLTTVSLAPRGSENVESH